MSQCQAAGSKLGEFHHPRIHIPTRCTLDQGDQKNNDIHKHYDKGKHKDLPTQCTLGQGDPDRGSWLSCRWERGNKRPWISGTLCTQYTQLISRNHGPCAGFRWYAHLQPPINKNYTYDVLQHMFEAIQNISICQKMCEESNIKIYSMCLFQVIVSVSPMLHCAFIAHFSTNQ